MSSQWVNKFVIMRDLSMAQGGIPVDVADTVIGDQKPPLQNITEETEEEFYRNWVAGDGDFSAPDFGFIKHMLNVVKQYDGSSDVEDEAEKVIEITKVSNLNPLTPIFKQPLENKFGECTKNAIKAKSKVKKQRNMAIESLLQNLENCSDSVDHDKVNLLKPTDFTESKAEAVKENISQAINKVSGWLDTQGNQKIKEKKKKNPVLNMTLDPASMFKKKEQSSTIKNGPIEHIVSVKPPVNGYKEYVPSSNAAEYYKKFLECSRMKQILQEDVWGRAERQMKEIEEQRTKEAELSVLSVAQSKSTESPSSQTTSSDQDDRKLDAVRLPSHRHDLPSPCIVCSVMNKVQTAGTNENWREENEDLFETVPDIVKGQIKSWRTRHDNSKDTITAKKETTWRSLQNESSNDFVKGIHFREDASSETQDDGEDSDDDEFFELTECLQNLKYPSDSD